MDDLTAAGQIGKSDWDWSIGRHLLGGGERVRSVPLIPSVPRSKVMECGKGVWSSFFESRRQNHGFPRKAVSFQQFAPFGKMKLHHFFIFWLSVLRPFFPSIHSIPSLNPLFSSPLSQFHYFLRTSPFCSEVETFLASTQLCYPLAHPGQSRH